MHLGGGAGRVFYVKGRVREWGDGVRTLQAGCIPRPEPKPALGLDDTASSMLSPKGDHDRKVGGVWRGGGGGGTKRRVKGRGKVVVGDCRPLWSRQRA